MPDSQLVLLVTTQNAIPLSSTLDMELVKSILHGCLIHSRAISGLDFSTVHTSKDANATNEGVKT